MSDDGLRRSRSAPGCSDRLARNPQRVQDPERRARHLHRPRRPRRGRLHGSWSSLIDQDRIPSGLLAPTGDPEFRTSESCNLNPHNPVVEEVEAKIHAVMGIDPVQARPSRASATRSASSSRRITISSTPSSRLLAGNGADRRPAHLDGDDLPERARGRRRDLLRESRRQGDAAARQPARPGTISTPRAGPIPSRCTRACRSPPASNISSPNGIASGPGSTSDVPVY